MTTPLRRALLVANPIAGRGRGAAAARALCGALEHGGLEVERFETSAGGDARSRVAELAPEEVDLVVSVGGDGTLREVLEGLRDRATPVGVLPLGTANVMARALGLPRSPVAAAAAILTGRARPVDVARANGRLSVLCCGAGADSLAVRHVEERRRGPITLLHYVRALAAVLVSWRAPALAVEIDGEPVPGTFGQVFVSNTARYAGVLRLDPGARLDDGRWEVYLLPVGSRPALLAAGLRGLLLRLPGPSGALFRARRVRVSTADGAPFPMQVDGDLAGTVPLQFELEPEPVHLIVPPR